MADRRFCVVAPNEAAADALLGLVPDAADATVVILGLDASGLTPEAASLPAASIVVVPDLAPDSDAEVVGPALRPLIEASDVVVLDSSQPGRDLAGWLCATLDAPLVWAIDAIRLTPDGVEADRVVLGGSHRLVHQVDGDLLLVLGKPTVPASQQARTAGQATVTELEVQLATSRVRVLEPAADDVHGVPLAAARIVISVGRGIGGPQNVETFRKLADVTGAALGASRVAVDSGWVPFAHQVGQTGTAVAPDVYVAFGISGAIQHLAGMRGSRSVIAVNTDTDAPLCRLADVVIEADAVEVAQTLLSRLG